MDPITLILLGSSAIYFLNKKSKSTRTKIVPKEIKGFEISKNCNNIIIYDIKKAKQWLLNSIIKEKLSATEINKIIFDSCKMDDLLPTSKNYYFVYDIFTYILNYFINKNISKVDKNFDELLILYVTIVKQYTILTSILKQENIDIEKFKLPILIIDDKLKEELINRRSYLMNDCTIEIEDHFKMGIFARKISELIPFMDNIELSYEIFHNIMFDQCENVIDLNYKDEYNLGKDFFGGQVKNKTISLTEANAMLSEWIEEYNNEGLDTEDLKPLSPIV